MAYELYKQSRTMEDYFESWDSSSYAKLTKALKETIYHKYMVKCAVFNRDSFRCQNKESTEDGFKPCPWCSNMPKSDCLTMHHIKAQRNDGADKPRNCVTLCKTAHSRFEKAKAGLTFSNDKHLPAHIRGKTFKLDKPDKINWDKIRAEMKALRKTLKDQHGLVLTWEQVLVLIKFLEVYYKDL